MFPDSRHCAQLGEVLEFRAFGVSEVRMIQDVGELFRGLAMVSVFTVSLQCARCLTVDVRFRCCRRSLLFRIIQRLKKLSDLSGLLRIQYFLKPFKTVHAYLPEYFGVFRIHLEFRKTEFSKFRNLKTSGIRQSESIEYSKKIRKLEHWNGKLNTRKFEQFVKSKTRTI